MGMQTEDSGWSFQHSSDTDWTVGSSWLASLEWQMAIQLTSLKKTPSLLYVMLSLQRCLFETGVLFKKWDAFFERHCPHQGHPRWQDQGQRVVNSAYLHTYCAYNTHFHKFLHSSFFFKKMLFMFNVRLYKICL